MFNQQTEKQKQKQQQNKNNNKQKKETKTKTLKKNWPSQPLFFGQSSHLTFTILMFICG